MQKRRVIVTHPKAHFEERLCLFALMSGHWKSAEEQFPGVSDANLVYWNELPEGTTREQWETAGCIFIGRFGGPFDEHPAAGQEREKNESAVSLLSKKLGIDQDWNFERLLSLTTSRDLHLGGGPFEFPSLVKKMNESSTDENKIHAWTFKLFELIYSYSGYFDGVTPSAGISWGEIFSEWMTTRFAAHRSEGDREQFPRELFKEGPMAVATTLGLADNRFLKTILEFSAKRWEKPCGNVLEPHAFVDAMQEFEWSHATIADWAFTALDAIYERAVDFFTVATADFAKADIFSIQIGERRFLAVAGMSDSTQFSKYARSSHGCRAGIVIQRNKRGNVMIETNNDLQLDLGKVLELYRIAELKRKGLPIPTDVKLLRGEAAIPNCPEWYGQLDAYRILNGSTTAERPATKISWSAIIGMAFSGLGAKWFPLPQRTIAAQHQQNSVLAIA